VTPSAVVFDVGNVLYGWDPDSFLVRQIADDDARMRFVDDVGLWDWTAGVLMPRPRPSFPNGSLNTPI
jgi:FMN phosphatase YigB (HAD superfamily)